MENQFKKREEEKSLKIDKLEKKIDDLLALNLKLNMEKAEALKLQTSEPFGEPNNDSNEAPRSHRDTAEEVTLEPVKMEPLDTLSSIPYIVVSPECELEKATLELELNKETSEHRVVAIAAEEETHKSEEKSPEPEVATSKLKEPLPQPQIDADKNVDQEEQSQSATEMQNFFSETSIFVDFKLYDKISITVENVDDIKMFTHAILMQLVDEIVIIDYNKKVADGILSELVDNIADIKSTPSIVQEILDELILDI